MKLGFKKSVLGFNCKEVVDYIQKNHKIFTKTKENYEQEISLLKNKINALEESVSFLSSSLEKYILKEAEINELSKKITEMFLVSQKGAESVLQNAVESRKESDKLLEQNINVVNTANNTFNSLEQSLEQTVEDFNKSILELKENLNSTKEMLTNRKIYSEEFEKTLKNTAE